MSSLKFSKKRVFCLEKYQDTCDFLEILLSDYETIFVGNLAQARNVLENQQFDFYILENILDDGSGSDLCREILARQPNALVIFASVVSERQAIRQALESGAKAYLVKPYDSDELLKIIKDLFESNH